MLSRVAAVTAAGTVLAFAVAGRDDSRAKDRGRELVEDVCTYCHNLDRLRGKELSREEWRGFTKGMISEGPPVTDEELSMILDYLAKNYGTRRPQETR
jgi:mono/diheme cytochrome c family protein